MIGKEKILEYAKADSIRELAKKKRQYEQEETDEPAS